VSSLDHPALLIISFVEIPDIAAAVADAALVEWAVKVSSMPASLSDFLIQRAMDEEDNGLCGGTTAINNF